MKIFGNLKSWATWSLIITFIIGGLGAVTGLVPPNIAAVFTVIVSGLGAVLHSQQVSNQVADAKAAGIPLK